MSTEYEILGGLRNNSDSAFYFIQAINYFYYNFLSFNEILAIFLGAFESQINYMNI